MSLEREQGKIDNLSGVENGRISERTSLLVEESSTQ